jgi:phosphotransferase system  glucose/maltose/N-acetylglucosamine-specific IIC component
MMGKMLYNYRNISAVIIGVIVFAFILPSLMPVIAQTQGGIDDRLKQAEQKFYDGLFDDSITILNGCLKDSDITKQERARAHELLAKVYLSKDYQEQAQSAIKKLLELVPNYAPNPDKDTPTYVALVEKVKAEQPQQKEQQETSDQQESAPWYKNTWVIVGAVAVVGAVVAVLLLTKKDEKKKAQPPVYLP